jgi:hypothetical protein
MPPIDIRKSAAFAADPADIPLALHTPMVLQDRAFTRRAWLDRANIGRRHASAAPVFAIRSAAGLSSGPPGGERLHVGCFQSFAPDGPVSAFEFVDTNRGDAAHILPFDLDHRFGDSGDEILLLLRRKNVLDDINGNERHVISLSEVDTAAGTVPPLVIEVDHVCPRPRL